MKRELTKKQQKRVAIFTLLLGIALMLLMAAVVGKPLLKFANQPEKFRVWVENRGVIGRIAYALMVFAQVIIAIIPGEPVEILGGYAFGIIEGTVICLFFSALGSLAVFALIRRFGKSLAEAFFTKEKINSLGFLKSSEKRDFVVLMIFMLPGTPKDLISYFVGLTDMKYGVWLLICSLGRIPSIVTSTVGGNALGKEKYIFAVIVFAATLLISIGSILLYNSYVNCKNKRQ